MFNPEFNPIKKDKRMVSIIVPTYNRANSIGESVQSVLDQTYSNWELIILEDGSTDNTGDVLKPYLKDPRISYYNRPSFYTKGANACRTYGFELANGEYVKWLDSDDLLKKNYLEIQLDQIQKEKADMNIFQSEFFSTDEKAKNVLGNKLLDGVSMKALVLTGESKAAKEFSTSKNIFYTSHEPFYIAEKIA